MVESETSRRLEREARRRLSPFSLTVVGLLVGCVVGVMTTYLLFSSRVRSLETELDAEYARARKHMLRVWELQDKYEPCAGSALWREIDRTAKSLYVDDLDNETRDRTRDELVRLVARVPEYAYPRFDRCPRR